MRSILIISLVVVTFVAFTALAGGFLLVRSGQVAQASPAAQDFDPVMEGEALAQGVSPADPDVEPPDAEFSRCPECGAESRYGKHNRRGHDRGLRGKGQGKGQRGKGRAMGTASDRFLRQAVALKLTDEQKTKLEQLAYDSQRELIDLRAAAEKERLEWRQEMSAGGDDLTRLKRRLDSMSKARVSIQEAKLTNWIESKKILTEDQKEMIEERHPRMGRFLD